MTHAAQSELLRALAAIAGIAEAEMGATVCKRLNKQLQIILESTPHVTLDEMRLRYRMHRKYWPECKVTPESLAKRWTEIASQQPRLIPGDSERVREPSGWRDHAETILHEMEPSSALYLARQAWAAIPEHVRRVIVARHASAPNVVPFQNTA